MSPNAETVCVLVDIVDRELKTDVGNGTIEEEFHCQQKNIVSAPINQLSI
jgi:hypothetical protein